MAITEVFPNPTVKKVIFQIRFPNLFFIEDKIGDFQVKIMREFPESKLIFRHQVLVVDKGEEASVEISPALQEDAGKKQWQFISKEGVILNIHGNSLDISSESHKTYNQAGDHERFRDTIENVMQAFLDITQIQNISRIGLMYMNECPLPAMTNGSFSDFYQNDLPIERFNLEDTMRMSFEARVRQGAHFLTFRERVEEDESGSKLALDLDAYAKEVESSDYLTVLDALHEMIIEAFENTIKEPVYEHMRGAE